MWKNERDATFRPKSAKIRIIYLTKNPEMENMHLDRRLSSQVKSVSFPRILIKRETSIDPAAVIPLPFDIVTSGVGSHPSQTVIRAFWMAKWEMSNESNLLNAIGPMLTSFSVSCGHSMSLIALHCFALITAEISHFCKKNSFSFCCHFPLLKTSNHWAPLTETCMVIFWQQTKNNSHNCSHAWWFFDSKARITLTIVPMNTHHMTERMMMSTKIHWCENHQEHPRTTAKPDFGWLARRPRKVTGTIRDLKLFRPILIRNVNSAIFFISKRFRFIKQKWQRIVLYSFFKK